MFERLSKAGFAPDLSDSGITSLAPGAWVSLPYFFHAPIHYLEEASQRNSATCCHQSYTCHNDKEITLKTTLNNVMG